MITFGNNLGKAKSEAAWAGAPSGGILPAGCLQRGSHTSLGTTAYCPQRWQQEILAPLLRGAWDMAASPGGCRKGKECGPPLPSKSGRSPRGTRAGLQHHWGLPGEHGGCSHTPRTLLSQRPPMASARGNLADGAGAASISAKPDACYSTITFPNSTFFAFWYP